MAKKIPCWGTHREFGNFAKTQGKVVNSLVLKIQGISKFAAKIFQQNLKLDKSAKSVSCVYVIVTNHINWHRENLPSNRENTGNLKLQFE